MSEAQWHASAPALDESTQHAFLAWRFCGGWAPALVPAAAAFYEIEDLELVLEQLIAIRDAIDRHQDAQRKHGSAAASR